MKKRGGRRSTTWKSSWKTGKTKVIRIPEILADRLYKIARHLDDGGKCVLQDKNCLVTDNIAIAINLLEESLEIPNNKGDAIKIQVKKAIKLLRSEKL